MQFSIYLACSCVLFPFRCVSCPVIYRLPAKKMVAMRLASKSDDNPQWTRLRDQLLSFSHNAYKYIYRF